MSVEDSKKLGILFFSEMDRLKNGPSEELCAASYTANIARSFSMDLNGHKDFAQEFYFALPDLSHQIEEVTAEGDKVIIRFTLKGTHSSDFLGIPSTNEQLIIPGLAVLKILNGKISEFNVEYKETEMLQQLGLMPAQS